MQGLQRAKGEGGAPDPAAGDREAAAVALALGPVRRTQLRPPLLRAPDIDALGLERNDIVKVSGELPLRGGSDDIAIGLAYPGVPPNSGTRGPDAG